MAAVQRTVTVRDVMAADAPPTASEFIALLEAACRRSFGAPHHGWARRALPWALWTLIVAALLLTPAALLFAAAPALPLIALGIYVLGSGATFVYIALLHQRIVSETSAACDALVTAAGESSVADAVAAWRAGPRQLPGALAMAIADAALFAVFVVSPAGLPQALLGLAPGGEGPWGALLPALCALALLAATVPYYLALFTTIVPMGLFQSKALELTLDQWLAMLRERPTDFDVVALTRDYHAIRLILVNGGASGANQLITLTSYSLSALFGVVAFLTGSPRYNPYLAWITLSSVWGVASILVPVGGVASRLEQPVEEALAIRGTVCAAPGPRRDELDRFIAFLARAPLSLRWSGIRLNRGTVVRLASLIGSVLVFFLGESIIL